MYKLITIMALVSTIMIGCGGGSNTTTENDNNNNDNGNSQNQGFKYPSMFSNFDEFKMNAQIIPVDQAINVYALYTYLNSQQAVDAEVINLIDKNPNFRHAHCEKGSANGSGISYSEDDDSFSGEITYITSSGPRAETIEYPVSCDYSRFIDGTISFDSTSTGNINAYLSGPFFTGTSNDGYFNGTTAYTGSFSSTTDGDNIRVTVPNMEVFTVRSSASKPYEKGDYTEYEKVYYQNYNFVDTTTGEGDNRSNNNTTSFEAQWHENSSDFILLYNKKSSRTGDVLTYNITYELKVVGDESKTIQATHVSHMDENGHLIVTYTFTKDGKTKTESIDTSKLFGSLK